MRAKATHKKSLLVIVLFLISFSSYSQVVTPFTIRFQATQKGGIVFVSNSSVSCSSSASCTTAKNQIAPAGTGVNNSYNDAYIDIDGDATTFMSSSDSLNLPNCSKISFAGLYWGGENSNGGSNWANKDKVKIKVNNAAYQNLVADQLQVNTVGYNSYHCFKDITGIVTATGGKARFTLANIATRVGSSNRFGGWTIVIVYKNDLQLMRNLTVFDGLSNVSTANTVTDIPVTGFLTPLSGPVTLELGLVVYDGDRSYVGDSLLFNGAGTFVPVSDAVNPANDVFNSTFSRNGVQTPFRNPNINNSLGYDADIFFPNNTTKNYIGNNSTSAIIRQKTGGETYLTQVVTSVIDVYEPSLTCAVGVKDLNGGAVNSGDVLEYTFSVKNTGSDPSINTWIIDSLEGNATFVPGSIQILAGPNAGVKTDLTGDDQAEYDPTNRVVRVRVGVGANAGAGGRVVNSPAGADSTRFKFRVVVSSNCVLLRCDSIINNKIFIFGSGEISSNPFITEGTEGSFDAFGCPLPGLPITPINIASCPLPVATSNSPVCEGGTINLSIGPTLGATYSWTGPATFSSTLRNPTRTNMLSTMVGTYSITTKVSATCSYTTTVPVAMSISPSAVTSVTNIACKGVLTGAASALSAGTSPFKYSWSTIPAKTTQTITGLATGIYTVTITDANNCIKTVTAQVTEPTSYLVTQISTFTNAGCNGGSATATTTGGVSPYSYNWLPGSYSSPSVSGLAPGSYSVVVSDNVSCTASANVVINAVPPITLTSTITSITCYGNSNGAAAVAVTGGLAPYSYLWNNGNTNQTITGLVAGVYSLNVIDSQGCSKAIGVTVSQPTSLTVQIAAIFDILCADKANGIISANASGGMGSLSYSWAPIVGTNASLTGLSAGGTYTVTVTDQNNCTGTASGNVNKVTQLVSTTAIETVTCFGASDATLNPVTTGGTPGYTYLWIPTGTTNTSASGLGMGTYTVITSDSNGCTDTSFAYVVQPPALEINMSSVINNSTCNQPNGSISVTPTGGTGTYTYVWTPTGGTTTIATGLPAGAYTIEITDAAGCKKDSTTALTDLTGPTITFITKTDVSCFGGSDGTILASFTSGTPGPYNIVWSPTSVTSSTAAAIGNFSASGLAADNYSVTVTDPTGCVGVALKTILQPTLLQGTQSTTNALCKGLNGSASVLAFGGTQPYSYQWNTAPIQTSTTVTGLPAGNYQVTITDSKLCPKVLSYTVTEPATLTLAIASSQNSTCYGFNNGKASVTPTGGTAQYLYTWMPGNFSGASVIGMSPNTYTSVVTDKNGCQAQAKTIITQPNLLTLAVATFTNLTCFTNNSGTASVTATGGTPTYTYTWSNGVGSTTNSNVTGLASGNYFITLTDNNNCSANTNVSLTQPPLLSVFANTLQSTKCNLANGSASAVVSGGTSPFAYNWSPGAFTNSSITGLSPNSYSLVVTDNNGCTATSNNTSVNSSLAVTASMNNTIVSCFGGNDGTAGVIVNNALTPILYNWSPVVSVTNFANNLSQGNYNVTVYDANGCTAITSTTVSQPVSPLSLNPPTTQPVNCYGGSNGELTAVPIGGTPTFSYLWSPTAQTNAHAVGLSAGTYTVLVTDSKNCSTSTNYSVTQNPQIIATTVDPPEFLCPSQSTTLVANATGGSGAGYIFTWNNGLGVGQSHLVSPTSTTIYNVNVEDAAVLGCMGVATEVVVNVSDYSQLNFQAYSSQTLCEGDSALVTSVLTGAVNNFQYTWSNGVTSQESFYVVPTENTTYSVSATNDCNQTINAFVEIGLIKMPIINILPGKATRCGPQSVEFKNNSIPPVGTEYEYTWIFENKVVSTAMEPNYTFKQTGTFPIVLKINDRGCVVTDTAQVKISISDPPIAQFSYSPEEIKELNPTVYFYNKSFDANYYKWYFTAQESDSSEVENPYYQYADTGIFKVKLIAYKIVGDSTCRDTIVKELRINPEITLFVPSAFTPNGDNFNGLFFAKGINLKEIYMEVYDRWGAKVYETPDRTDLKAGWDGTYKGQPAKQDVYIYRIVIKDYKGKEYAPFIGNVTLLR